MGRLVGVLWRVPLHGAGGQSPGDNVCVCAEGAVAKRHCAGERGQWTMEILQYTATVPGPVGSGMPWYTATLQGQWAVESGSAFSSHTATAHCPLLWQCTAKFPLPTTPVQCVSYCPVPGPLAARQCTAGVLLPIAPCGEAAQPCWKGFSTRTSGPASGQALCCGPCAHCG